MSDRADDRDKRQCFEQLLESGIAALHLDSRRPGVTVPSQHAGQPWLVLHFSYRFHLEDFRFDDEAVEASLSFSGRPVWCRIPWTAVFAVTNEARDQGLMWSHCMPAEAGLGEQERSVASGSSSPDSAAPPPERAEPRPNSDASPSLNRGRASFRVIDGGEAHGSPTEDAGPATTRSHLRRVK